MNRKRSNAVVSMMIALAMAAGGTGIHVCHRSAAASADLLSAPEEMSSFADGAPEETADEFLMEEEENRRNPDCEAGSETGDSMWEPGSTEVGEQDFFEEGAEEADADEYDGTEEYDGIEEYDGAEEFEAAEEYGDTEEYEDTEECIEEVMLEDDDEKSAVCSGSETNAGSFFYSGGTEMTESCENGTETPADTSVEAFLPSERVRKEDLVLLLGDGRSPDVDGEIDAVRELLRICPEDIGLLQMAAEKTGKTEETAGEAERALQTGASLEEETVEALENAGMGIEDEGENGGEHLSGAESLLEEAEAAAGKDAVFGFSLPLLPRFLSAKTVFADDRQSGRSLEYTPCASPGGAMARVSSFLLIRKKDGSGDWDREGSYVPEDGGYDWKGNDSSDHNGVVRTGDDVTWTFAYTTALADAYMYNTIRGTRMYVSWCLPAGPEEAVFNVDAMPWLLGDGPEGKPVLTQEDGFQILTGYRDLPDREEEDACYDVPGAGTLNCVVSIRSMKTRQSLTPSFSVWLEHVENERAPADAMTAGTSAADPAVRITCGPNVSVTLRKPASNERSCYGTHTSMNSLYEDGSSRDVQGRLKVFPFTVKAGKPGGILKGAEKIDRSHRIRVYFTGSCTSSNGMDTNLGITDIVTMSMTDETGKRAACFRSGDDYSLSVYENVPLRRTGGDVSGRIMDMGTENGRFYFDIEGFANDAPGSLLSEGYIVVNQKQTETCEGKEHLTATLTAQAVRACSAGNPGVEQEFSQKYTDDAGNEVYPSCTLESEVDNTGTWDAHLVLTEKWDSTGSYITGGGMSTAGVIGYGNSFGAMICQWRKCNKEENLERSKEWFLLWDNRLLEMKETDGGGIKEYHASLSARKLGGELPARYIYITKKDGSVWNSSDEMLEADFASFRDLRFWPTYEDAVSHGIICGLLCETWGFDEPLSNEQLYDTFEVHLTTVSDPSIIGRSCIFTYGMRTFRTDVKSRSSYADSADGMGSLPDAPASDVVKLWNMGTPRTYAGTEWDASGTVKPESIVMHNTVHEGNSVYISGCRYSIRDTLLNGLEAVTHDLAETDSVGFRIEPGFLNADAVHGVNACVYSPDPLTEDGRSPVQMKTVAALTDGGEERVLEEGKTYQMSAFISGAPGSFVMTRERMSDQYNGREYSGDPLSGKTMLLEAGPGSGLVLTPASSGAASGQSLALSPKNGEKGALNQRWIFTKIQEGLYYLRNAETDMCLSTESGNAESGTKLNMVTSGKENQKIHWIAGRLTNGRYKLYYMKSGMEEAAGTDAPGNGSDVRLCPAGGSSVIEWELIPCGEEEPHGTKIAFENLSSEYPMPVFLKRYALDKSTVDEDTTLTDTALITGDGSKSAASRSNFHMASSSAAFVETSAQVLRIKTDKAEIENGEELGYTILYTNEYDRNQNVEIADVLPSSEETASFYASSGRQRPCDMEEGNDSSETGTDGAEEYAEAAAEWAGEYLTSEGAGSISLIDGSVEAKGSAGSPMTVRIENNTIRVSGEVKPGESVRLTYRVKTEGARPGEKIRNSCRADLKNGTVYSNRTETVVKGIPAEKGPHISLSAGGAGNGRVRTVSLLLILLLMMCRAMCKTVKNCPK